MAPPFLRQPASMEPQPCDAICFNFWQQWMFLNTLFQMEKHIHKILFKLSNHFSDGLFLRLPSPPRVPGPMADPRIGKHGLFERWVRGSRVRPGNERPNVA